MKKFVLTIVLAMLCLFFRVNAQSQTTNIKPLNIGDTIPEAVWNMPLQVVNHPEGKKTITLNDYKGKLIILDFWATWCGSCIAAMPKLQQLKEQFKDQINIIAVTATPAKEVITFLKMNATVKPLNLATVTDDVALKQAFPHLVIPHLVWIAADGSYSAATGSDQVNLPNIQQFIERGKQSLRQKIDLAKGSHIFLQEPLLAANTIQSYSLFFKGIYDGLPSGHKEFLAANKQLTGISSTNLPLIEIYEKCIYSLFKEKGIVYTYKRRVIEGDSFAIQQLVKDDKKPELFSEIKDLYSYTRRGTPMAQETFYKYMLTELNANSGYYGTIAKKATKCLVLRLDGNSQALKTKGGPRKQQWLTQNDTYINNYPISYMVNRINALSGIELLIVDETGFSGNVDIQIKGKLNRTNLAESLHNYGLSLSEETRMLDLFVISNKDSK